MGHLKTERARERNIYYCTTGAQNARIGTPYQTKTLQNIKKDHPNPSKSTIYYSSVPKKDFAKRPQYIGTTLGDNTTVYLYTHTHTHTHTRTHAPSQVPQGAWAGLGWIVALRVGCHGGGGPAEGRVVEGHS